MPPSSTRTYTLFPYTTLFLSGLRGRRRAGLHALHGVGRGYAPDAVMSKSPRGAAWLAKPVSRLNPMRADRAHRPAGTVRPPPRCAPPAESCRRHRSEEHTSELQSLMRISYAVFCLKKKKKTPNHNNL